MVSTLDILKRLIDAGVEFVVVGGIAAVAHGSVTVTEDVDVCAPLDRANLTKLLVALNGLEPHFRMVSASKPLPKVADELVGFNNIYLTTTLGQLDVLSEIDGVGRYDAVYGGAVEMDLGGCRCMVVGLDHLIRAKRALNRPKDVQAVIELEALRERLRRRESM